jgi:hypothetical protein
VAQLMFITETGMFHVACACTWGKSVEWYGFKPREHRAPAGRGFVDRSDRKAYMNHYITFDVQDAILRFGVDRVKAKYDPSRYLVTVHDCVSFAADVAREAGLLVPRVNITPYGFIEILAVWNVYTSKG